MATRSAGVCLVTGGAGFIGSHLVDRLLAEGYVVRVLDNFSTGRMTHLTQAAALKGLVVYETDITDVCRVRQAMAGVDYVFHLAAVSSEQQANRDPELAFETNLFGTQILLQEATKAGVKQFIFSSTSAVYGEQPLPHREDRPVSPVTIYGNSKLGAEREVLNWDGLAVVLRYFNVYGSRQRTDREGGVVAYFVDRQKNDQSLIIEGTGEQTRDFVHVDDVVTANLAAMKWSSATGEIFNIGTGQATSIFELAVRVMRMGQPSTNKVEHTEPWPNDIYRSVADINKAGGLLGWRASIGLEVGLARLFQEGI